MIFRTARSDLAMGPVLDSSLVRNCIAELSKLCSGRGRRKELETVLILATEDLLAAQRLRMQVYRCNFVDCSCRRCFRFGMASGYL